MCRKWERIEAKSSDGPLQLTLRKIPNPLAYQTWLVTLQNDLSDLIACDTPLTYFASHFYYSLNIPGNMLPQSLCSCCSFCLECSSPDIHWFFFPLPYLGLCSSVTFSGDLPWSPYLKLWCSTFFIFLPSFPPPCYHLSLSDVIWILLIYFLLSLH